MISLAIFCVAFLAGLVLAVALAREELDRRSEQINRLRAIIKELEQDRRQLESERDQWHGKFLGAQFLVDIMRQSREEHDDGDWWKWN